MLLEISAFPLIKELSYDPLALLKIALMDGDSFLLTPVDFLCYYSLF